MWGTSLVVLWLGFCTSTAGDLSWIPSLIWEQTSRKLQGMAKKKKKKKSGTISSTRDVQVYLAPAQRVHTVRLDRQEARFALLEEALASKAASSPFYKWEN